jgi:hypothetical protein
MHVRSFFRDWLMPLGGVFGIVATLFFATGVLDYQTHRPDYAFFLSLISGDPNTLRYSLTAVAQSLAATLGLMTAIVLVIVQLSANRYSPKIIDSFTHNSTNLTVFSLFIISIVYSLWVANSIHTDYVPWHGALVSMMLMSLCFGLVIPYFLFIFRILNPRFIVDQLRKEAIDAIHRAHRNPTLTKDMRKVVVRRIEQIADIAMSCVQNMDVEVAHHCVWAFQSLISIYIQEKKAFPEDWHSIEENHMIGSPRRLAEEIIKRQGWVEFRALRQLRILYRHSSGSLTEINSLISQVMRSSGHAAVVKSDFSVLEIVVMFFNSLVRGALAMKDGRACGDTLYQYRLLAEEILEVKPELTERIVSYFMYYGRMLLEVEIRQIFDTLCYDIRKINERALKVHTSNFTCRLEAPVCSRILGAFLGLHDKIDHRKYEMQSRALLKHYVNLASFYLLRGQEDFARRIFEKIKNTPMATLRDIQHEIASVTEPLFWEISDRVINFNFISPEQREELGRFIGWFEEG